jgi:putative DNA primase/helicase
VPRLDLADEIVQTFADRGINAAVYRGRDTDDPQASPKAKMCREGDRVAAIQGALASVSQKACRTKDAECQFYKICSYQAQQKLKPRVWIVTHPLLFRERPTFIPQPGQLCIDEAFWSQSLHGDDRPYSMWLNDLRLQRPIYHRGAPKRLNLGATNDLLVISQRIAAAIEADGPGRIRRDVLNATRVALEDVRAAYKLEWERKIELADVLPGIPLPLVRERCQRIADHNQQIARLCRFFDLLARTLETECDRSPWLEMRFAELPNSENREPAIFMIWRDGIHPSWDAHGSTMILNAATRPQITRLFYPHAAVPTMHTVAMPYTHVTQIIDRAMTEAHNMRNVEKIRRYIEVRAAEIAGQVLVVCQAELEAALIATGTMPANVALAHFNATAGLNAWQDVELLIVIGRTEPSPRTVERIARALFGCEVREIEPNEHGQVWYPRVPIGIRMRDGRAAVVLSNQHPDWRVELIRWLVCEAELVQAIGRGRGVRRTTMNPLQVEILCSIPLPIEVDEVTSWDDAQPSLARVMRARGAVPTSYGDMARAYPDLFPSGDAARMALRRENPEQTLISYILYKALFGVSSIPYRRAGSRGPAGQLLFDPARINPVEWLTSHLGR